MGSLSNPSWRVPTRPCPFYSKGTCIFAQKCNFVHDVKVRRPDTLQIPNRPSSPNPIPHISYTSPTETQFAREHLRISVGPFKDEELDDFSSSDEDERDASDDAMVLRTDYQIEPTDIPSDGLGPPIKLQDGAPRQRHRHLGIPEDAPLFLAELKSYHKKFLRSPSPLEPDNTSLLPTDGSSPALTQELSPLVQDDDPLALPLGAVGESSLQQRRALQDFEMILEPHLDSEPPLELSIPPTLSPDEAEDLSSSLGLSNLGPPQLLPPPSEPVTSTPQRSSGLRPLRLPTLKSASAPPSPLELPPKQETLPMPRSRASPEESSRLDDSSLTQSDSLSLDPNSSIRHRSLSRPGDSSLSPGDSFLRSGSQKSGAYGEHSVLEEVYGRDPQFPYHEADSADDTDHAFSTMHTSELFTKKIEPAKVNRTSATTSEASTIAGRIRSRPISTVSTTSSRRISFGRTVRPRSTVPSDPHSMPVQFAQSPLDEPEARSSFESDAISSLDLNRPPSSVDEGRSFSRGRRRRLGGIEVAPFSNMSNIFGPIQEVNSPKSASSDKLRTPSRPVSMIRQKTPPLRINSRRPSAASQTDPSTVSTSTSSHRTPFTSTSQMRKPSISPSMTSLTSANSLSNNPAPHLFFALASDSPNEVSTLLKTGQANANDTAGPQDLPALVFALTNDGLKNKIEIGKKLLEYGADAEAVRYLAGDGANGSSHSPSDEKETDNDSPLAARLKASMNPAIEYYLSRPPLLASSSSAMTASTSSSSRGQGPAQLAALKNGGFDSLLRMRYNVIGQDLVLEGLVKAVASHSRKIASGTERRASLALVFAGPSGHGKSLVASKIGSLLEVPLYNVNMTNLRSQFDLLRSPSLAAESDDSSNLLHFLTRHEGRRCVVVLEEIEKVADKEALHTLLLPWDIGRLPVSSEQILNTTEVIWVCTSNVAENEVFEFWNQPQRLAKDLSAMDKEQFARLTIAMRSRLGEVLGAPILSRVDAVLPFLPFTIQEQKALASEMLEQISRTHSLESSSSSDWLDSRSFNRVVDRAVDRFIEKEGARSLRRGVEALYEVGPEGLGRA